MKIDSALLSGRRKYVSGNDLDRTITSIERMIEYCERIVSYRERFGEKDVFLIDETHQDACLMVLGQIG